VIDVLAVVTRVKRPILSCTQQEVELSIRGLKVVSEVSSRLPLQIEDAARAEGR